VLITHLSVTSPFTPLVKLDAPMGVLVGGSVAALSEISTLQTDYQST